MRKVCVAISVDQPQVQLIGLSGTVLALHELRGDLSFKPLGKQNFLESNYQAFVVAEASE